MADNTAIEWTDATWNPITGCSIVSKGCTNCYAMKLAGTRLRHTPSRAGLTRKTNAGPVWTGEVRFNEEWLGQPLRWRRPRKIFVCAHGDLFAEAVPDDWIAQVYANMICAVHANGHAMQVLTKRAARARSTLGDRAFWDQVDGFVDDIIAERVDPLARRSDDLRATVDHYDPDNPPPGIWLGISAEDQATADERIPLLLDTPAAVRFVSAEPLLGPIDFQAIIPKTDGPYGRFVPFNSLLPRKWTDGSATPRLDWIIVGGESGPKARPMHPQWARDIRDQCQAAGAAFFFKQHGEYRRVPAGLDAALDTGDVGQFERVGKKAAGRLLDGREWSEFPEVRP